MWPAESDVIALISGDQMHVKVKYCLSCTGFIVLHYIISVAPEHIRQFLYHLFGEKRCLRKRLIIDVIQISVMFLRKDKGMAL